MKSNLLTTRLLVLLIIGQFSLLTWASNKKSNAEKPNIIIIYTDDHGYSDLSCQGVFDDVKTPNIDLLVKNGVRMTDGYSTAPQCVPSRGGLISGQYQNRFGLESNTQFKDDKILDNFDKLETVPERLKTAGYTTGMAGKWHLGPKDKIASHGFDVVFYKNSGAKGYTNLDIKNNKIVPFAIENTGMYHLDACSKAACTFIDMNKDKPFFFYLAYRAPHVPLDPPQMYIDRFPGEMPERRRKALAMLSAVDDGVGTVVETLKKNGLEENTIIFVIGDNGAPLKIYKRDAPGRGPGWDGSLNEPMNGEKGMLAEGGIRTPFVVSWKGKIPGGQIYKQAVIALDAGATAVALAGLEVDDQLDGVNLVPYLTGEKSGAPHEVLYWRWLGQSAIRKGKWKYLRSDNNAYLFDIESDYKEEHDIIKQHPEIAKALHADLEQWCGTLSPAGIWAMKSGSMSANAAKYYDFYFNGILPDTNGKAVE